MSAEHIVVKQKTGSSTGTEFLKKEQSVEAAVNAGFV